MATQPPPSDSEDNLDNSNYSGSFHSQQRGITETTNNKRSFVYTKGRRDSGMVFSDQEYTTGKEDN